MKRWMMAVFVLALNFNIQTGVSCGDEVTDTLDKARQAYEAKNYTQSLDALNQALLQIQKLVSQQVIQCLPTAMEGWQRKEPSSTLANEATFGLVSSSIYSVEAEFSKEPSEKVTVSISNIPHIVQIAKAGLQLLSNPFFSKMQQEGQPQEKMEPYKLGDFEGAQTINTAQKEIQITLFYGDMMLQVKSSGVEDFLIVEKFAKAVKFDELKKFSGKKS